MATGNQMYSTSCTLVVNCYFSYIRIKLVLYPPWTHNQSFKFRLWIKKSWTAYETAFNQASKPKLYNRSGAQIQTFEVPMSDGYHETTKSILTYPHPRQHHEYAKPIHSPLWVSSPLWNSILGNEIRPLPMKVDTNI